MALNNAARSSTQHTVDLLIDAGARKQFSVALQNAAGAIPYSATRKSEDDPVQLTLEEDCERIPIIARLLACGLNINALDDGEGPYKIEKPLDQAFPRSEVCSYSITAQNRCTRISMTEVVKAGLNSGFRLTIEGFRSS